MKFDRLIILVLCVSTTWLYFNPVWAEPLYMFPKPMILCSTEVIENYRLVEGGVRFIPYEGRSSGEIAWVEVSGEASCGPEEQAGQCKNRAVFNGLSHVFDQSPFRKPQLVKSATRVDENEVNGDRIELSHYLLIHPGIELLKEEKAGEDYQVVLRVGVSEVQEEENPRGDGTEKGGVTARVVEWCDNTAERTNGWRADQSRGIQRYMSRQARRFRDFIWRRDRGYDFDKEAAR